MLKKFTRTDEIYFKAISLYVWWGIKNFKYKERVSWNNSLGRVHYKNKQSTFLKCKVSKKPNYIWYTVPAFDNFGR